jgi:hypothetical protein
MGKLLIQIACLVVALSCLPICFFLDYKHSVSGVGISSDEHAGLSARTKIFLIGVAVILAMVEFYIY